MTTKQVKQGVIITLLGLALAFLMTNHKTATATAYDDEAGVYAATVGGSLMGMSELASFDAGAPGRVVDGDQQQDKPAAPQEKSAEEKPAEQVYKNIQVLKGVPASRLMAAMGFFTRSLGVKCDHCHVPREFDKDDKPAKQTARKMYEMVRVSNKELGSNRVSCFMCHRGNVQPEPPPDSLKAQAEEMMKKGGDDMRPAEQVYKNIQTLKNVPAGRWMPIMQMFSKSLGVDCTHCHVEGAFEKDDKPAKQTARKMLHMVGVIAKDVYKGPTSINCYTCHKGQAQPVSFPPQPQKTQ
ncbi:MAG TPA: photosynthetic reaction center cytochrome c subunit family protein [Blastocatellia bacterium]|jgi:hypothetical protein|nr:photosynthetic reaction center cytochrome c subunit family protein [Blastocatellia bacterium]